MQSQFFMEDVELFLDLLRTGAVLPCTEIQQDIDLQETDKHINKVERRVLGMEYKHILDSRRDEEE